MKIIEENKQLLINAGRIRFLVCEHYDITIADLFKPGRATREVVTAKQVICYLLIRVLECTQKYTADMVGLKSANSALFSRNAVADQITVYPKFKAEVELLEAKCRQEVK